MKNIVYALILSFFIHVLFLLVLHEPKDQNMNKIEKKEPKKQHITYIKLKQKEIPKKHKSVKKVPKKKEADLSVNLKKEIWKKTSPKSTSIKIEKELNQKKIIAKTKPKTIAKTTYNQSFSEKSMLLKKKKNFVLKNPKPNPIKSPLSKTKRPEEKKSLDLLSKKLQVNTLESFLSTPNLNENVLDKITQNYLDLYGDEFKSFTKVQKVFLKQNLKNIITVTRMYMRFPEVLLRKKHGGELVLEFLLYPNGDIGSILLTSSSGYTSLDKGAINTIKIAYPEYPKPRITTKIKLKMIYIYN
ncbi:TonB family protein [Arcobacter sp. HD9-500m-PIT-SAG03]|nr:TonB family protein [Arcobacter sp. HD9-500m-PIT-SAG03]